MTSMIHDKCNSRLRKGCNNKPNMMKGIKEDVKLLEMRVLKATYEHIKIWGKMNGIKYAFAK